MSCFCLVPSCLVLSCLLYILTGTGGEGGHRVEPEPTLISLEKPHAQSIEKSQSDNISNLTKDNKGKNLADELEKMKFATRPDFELD
jgi:hypothetical protein